MTQPKPSYSRGEVVLVLFPHSDLRTAKTHPALVIQADQLNTGLPQTIVAMITGNLSRAGHPSRVLVARNGAIGHGAGLLADSLVMADNLATVAETAIDRAIGMLPMAEVDEALRRTLEL